MAEYALPIALLGTLFLWCAWREHVAENRRDAKLLATCGAIGVLAGAGVWVV